MSQKPEVSPNVSIPATAMKKQLDSFSYLNGSA
jgi:hypothetical protein